MHVDVITIFPKLFAPFFQTSIPGIAAEKGLLTFGVHDLRDYTLDKHRKVDDKPFGGGPGMVFAPGPVFRAVEALTENRASKPLTLLMTPQGEPFDQAMAATLAREEALLFLCGHYEGFDERIRTGLALREISLGDFVLTGGELPAMAIIDAVLRLLPGVLGSAESGKKDSFSRNRLGFPQYTRPRIFRGMAVPEVLLSGDHTRIEQWREEMALARTQERRADLLKERTDEPSR
jgi:tRNA (guanine37-N1)-methyltransferase